MAYSGSGRTLRRSCPGPFRIEGRTKRRSEEHTSELQSQSNLVCRLLLEKKKRSYVPRVRQSQLFTFRAALAVIVVATRSMEHLQGLAQVVSNTPLIVYAQTVIASAYSL